MRLTFALINISCLKYNFLNIRKKVKKSKVMAVVKADAYGHGMLECAAALNSLGDKRPDYYGLALLEEAVQLRESKIVNEPILSFAPFDVNEIDTYLKYKIMPTVCTIAQINQLKKIKKKLKVHINFDTGMGRLGISFKDALKFTAELSKNKNVIIDGIYTHFATSDEKNKDYAKLQLQRFNSIITGLK
jgi:alanine racemase